MILQGITVTLIDRVQTGVDAFRRPVYKEMPVEVPNVLVIPVGSDDLPLDDNIKGNRIRYNLCIPKEDGHAWHAAEVEFYGKRWQAVGVPELWIPELVPLGWNKRVTVERYE